MSRVPVSILIVTSDGPDHAVMIKLAFLLLFCLCDCLGRPSRFFTQHTSAHVSRLFARPGRGAPRWCVEAKRRRKTGTDSRRVQRMLDAEEEVDWALIEEEEKAAKERQIEAMRYARAAAKGIIPNPGVGIDPLSAPQSAKELGIEDFGKARIVQWYPGHIHKAENALKDQLKMVDVVIEVRDSRIPKSTTHPKLEEWTKHKRRLLVINRMECIGSEERLKWTEHFRSQGVEVFWTNGKEGKGIDELLQAAIKLSGPVNEARKMRGLLPRAPRIVIVGYPNVGKSALINRLTKRRVVESAPIVGVTRQLRWVRLGTKMGGGNDGVDLLDTPGLLPMRQEDQFTAQKLAMCNEIGEASYLASIVAEEMVAVVNSTLGKRFLDRLRDRYGVEVPSVREDLHTFVSGVAEKLFAGDKEMAGKRILHDFNEGKFGPVALELP